MDWKSFGIGMAVGAAAGVGISWLVANRYEVVDDDGFEDVVVEHNPIGDTCADPDVFDEISLADTITRYEPSQENNESEENSVPDEMAEMFANYMIYESGVGPGEDPDAAYVISEHDYEHTNCCWDKVHMTFYPDNDLMVTDEERMVDDPSVTIGSNVFAFVKESWYDFDDPVIFVRNPRHSTDYMVDLRTKYEAEGWIRDYLEGMDG